MLSGDSAVAPSSAVSAAMTAAFAAATSSSEEVSVQVIDQHLSRRDQTRYVTHLGSRQVLRQVLRRCQRLLRGRQFSIRHSDLLWSCVRRQGIHGRLCRTDPRLSGRQLLPRVQLGLSRLWQHIHSQPGQHRCRPRCPRQGRH